MMVQAVLGQIKPGKTDNWYAVRAGITSGDKGAEVTAEAKAFLGLGCKCPGQHGIAGGVAVHLSRPPRTSVMTASLSSWCLCCEENQAKGLRVPKVGGVQAFPPPRN